MRSIRVLQSIFMLLILPCVAPAAHGQANVEVNAGIQFNFSTPGARSLAMGSAFLGLADDATAAYANPAGLTTLTRPEVSFEGRNWSYSNVFTDRGRLFGDPTSNGVDTIAGLHNGESTNRVSGLSFLSVVFPWSRWRIAFYRHELANFEADFNAQGAILSGTAEPGDAFTRLRPTRNTLDLDITNLGLSIAAQVSDSWSLGAGISSYDFHQASRTERFNIALDDPYGPPLYAPDNLADFQTQRGNDRALGFNAGFRWRIRDGLALGGAYRQGPKFDLTATRTSLANSEEDASKPARFDSPDFLGLGLSWEPTQTTLLNLDVDRIMYSQLTSHFSGIVKGEGDLDLTPGELRRFRVEDATEIHLGFEKTLSLFDRMVFARLGAWLDPDHRIRYEGDDPNFQALFRRGRDEIHYSAGLGVSSERAELNCAVDLSNRVDTLSISTVFRF